MAMTTTAPTQSPTDDAVAVAREAFAAVHTAADHALAAVAALGSTDLPLDVATLEWLVQEAQRVVNRHDRIRIRALDVVRRTREAGGSHHDNDAQFTAGRTHTDPRGAARDTHLAKAWATNPPHPHPTPRALPRRALTVLASSTELGHPVTTTAAGHPVTRPVQVPLVPVVVRRRRLRRGTPG
ncbi:hypothetical protein BJF82_11285 [Kytococcus sp. CUA-901]|nr:hypothetical protein BJF82_11285 [Kytococcus sp. CUA-901]